jgi:hypothetical protein
MPLPNNNLPSSSQQWAREIEKQLASLNQKSAANAANAIGADAASLANSGNLSSLLLDQVELRTYSTELDESKIQSVTFNSGINNIFDSDTRDLDIIISLNKPRKLLINYSTSYEVESLTAGSTLATSYGFDSRIFLNGTVIDHQPILKTKGVTTINDIIYDYDAISMTKLIAVPAGEHKISVTMRYSSTPASGGSMNMLTRGDNLIVTVLQ